MPYSVLDVAKWILAEAKRQGLTLTNMKLQKLLYYAQAYSLGMTGQPLFAEDIQAWRHGPVAPVAYLAYNMYGGSVIPAPDVGEVAAPDDDAPLIALLVRDKGQFSASALRNMTHEESPWKEAWAAWDGAGPKPVINPESMRDYFAPQFWASDEEDEYQPVFDSPKEERSYFLGRITDEERNAILASRYSERLHKGFCDAEARCHDRYSGPNEFVGDCAWGLACARIPL